MARRMKWKECDVHALALTQQSYSSRHSGSESSSDTSSCGSSAVSHNSSGSSEQGGNPNDFEPLSWESQTFDPAHYGSRVRDADSDQAVWNNFVEKDTARKLQILSMLHLLVKKTTIRV